MFILGAVFFSSYGFSNWLASRRADVGEVVFAWERWIPFAAWTIVPYWSIDALYAISLFLCRTRRELKVLVGRLLAAQAICIACFLLFPLRFTFERPATDRLFGAMFDVLMGFDKPFNQAPSLHIALLVILWVHYSQRVPPVWRWPLRGLFLLIGVSVLTTYQHHFIDVPTGLWVGWLCVWLFPANGPSPLAEAARTSDPVRRRLAAYYGTGSMFVAAGALWLGGAFLWLCWVAGSLMIVALIYGWLDAGAFQKRADGRLTGAATWLLAPYLAGAWLNSRWWTRSVRLAVVVVPGLLLGRIPSGAEVRRGHYAAVVDLCAELPVNAAGVHYEVVPMLDLTAPDPARLRAAVLAIDAARRQGPTLVCCALGYSRSALACVAWLVYAGEARDVDEASARVRQARPGVVLKPEFLQVASVLFFPPGRPA